jgi:hypothetical protein
LTSNQGSLASSASSNQVEGAKQPACRLGPG